MTLSENLKTTPGKITRVVVLSDTHIPRASPDIPERIYDEIKSCDLIIHAGDIVEKAFLEKLKGLKETVAVSGNMDAEDLRGLLKNKEIVTLRGHRIGIVHGYGAKATLSDTVCKEFSDVDAIIFGHSHNAVIVKKGKVLLFNPGSPTDTVFAPYRSYGIMEVSDEGIKARIEKIDQ